MNYKLGSLFDGSGGFPLAGAFCGIEPMWAAEVEPYPIAVTRSRFPNMKHLGDISKVSGAEIEPVDIITFGSPCQDLSVAGKRAGLKHESNGDEETTRSGLFMEAVRIIKEMRKKTNGLCPTFAIWENVPGAFSSNSGNDFRIVCEELIKIVEPSASMPPVPQNGWNYADSFVGDGWSLAYRVLDAQYWGVPQRRRRVYLVADFGGESAREVLFEREGLRGYFTQGRTPRQAAPADAEGGTGAKDREGEADRSGRGLDDVNDQYLFENHGQDSRYKGPLDICPMLSAQLGTGGNNQPLVMEPFCKSARARSAEEATTWKHAEIANTLNTFDQGEARANELVVSEDPVYCLQGSMIGRSDKNGPQGYGVNIDIAFTQNTTDRAAVAYVDTTHADDVIRVNNTVAPLQARDFKGGELICETHPRYIVRRLTPTECARLQGFPDRWGDIDHKDSLTDDEYGFWCDVRKTFDEINGIKPRYMTKEKALNWYNKLHTDSAEYKMWGNGIALPCALYVMQGIADALAEQEASLEKE
jgi:DNA (cytosine-5)-methyltransferase 1